MQIQINVELILWIGLNQRIDLTTTSPQHHYNDNLIFRRYDYNVKSMSYRCCDDVELEDRILISPRYRHNITTMTIWYSNVVIIISNRCRINVFGFIHVDNIVTMQLQRRIGLYLISHQQRCDVDAMSMYVKRIDIETMQ